MPIGRHRGKSKEEGSRLEGDNSQRDGEDHAGDGEHPHPQEVGLDVILDVHIGKAGAQQGGGNHGICGG